MSASPATPPTRLVTVDGPAGSGKTTLGSPLATVLDVPLIDTGLFYRGVMVAALIAGADASDPSDVIAIAVRTRIEVNTEPDPQKRTWSLRVDGEVADAVARDPANATLLARLSQIPGVRAVLLEQQRALAGSGAVAVGRDCGTIVFPWAPVKIYLQAAADIRTGRRATELRERGAVVDDARLNAEVTGRDALDSGRTVSPLRPADDAHIIDTGIVGIDEMVATALSLCRSAGLLPVREGIP